MTKAVEWARHSLFLHLPTGMWPPHTSRAVTVASPRAEGACQGELAAGERRAPMQGISPSCSTTFPELGPWRPTGAGHTNAERQECSSSPAPSLPRGL